MSTGKDAYGTMRVRNRVQGARYSGKGCQKQESASIVLVRGEAEHLPFKSGVFDVGLLLEVLEHIEDDRSALSEVRRILGADGEVVLSVPHPPAVYPDKHHKREGYTKDEMFGLLDGEGFRAISSEFCMFWISRMMLKFAAGFISTFRIPPPILPFLGLEHLFRRPPAFDIVIRTRK